jgi:hypothetical protein
VSVEVVVEEGEPQELDTSDRFLEQKAPNCNVKNNAVAHPPHEGAAEYDVLQDDVLEVADVEIEAEDVDTVAREMMPGVIRAIQQPNLREVDVEGSAMTVSELTTTFSFEEHWKRPAVPRQAGVRHLEFGINRQQVMHKDRTTPLLPFPRAPALTPLSDFTTQALEFEHESRAPIPPPSRSTPSGGSVSSHDSRTGSQKSRSNSTLDLEDDEATTHSTSTGGPPRLERSVWTSITRQAGSLFGTGNRTKPAAITVKECARCEKKIYQSL